MNRPLRIGVLALPWLLLAGVTFLAWLAWIHYQWKDRTLWERMLTDVEAASGQIEHLERGDITPVVAFIRARRIADCQILREEAHLAPSRLAERVEAAAALCD